MDQVTLRSFEAQCVQEEAPACQSMCPLHVDARTFIQCMADNKKDKARQILDKSLPLSSLTAFLCEGECQSACRRAEIDKGIQVHLLERACVLQTSPSRVMPFPSTNKIISLIGAGLSSLVLANELAKKGHKVTVFHVHEIGKEIEEQAKATLPMNALEECLRTLENLKVNFEHIAEIDEDFLNKHIEKSEIVYFALDDDYVAQSEKVRACIKDIDSINPITLKSEQEKILVGGSRNLASFIESISHGKKASLSVERIFQGVNPATAREKEAPYTTKLFTNLSEIENSKAIEFKNENIPTLDEAANEAKRCIQCSCLECVKQCSYLAHYKNYPKKYLREMYNNLAVVQGFRQANGIINTCTQCGLCEKICPQNLNMGEYITLCRAEMVKSKKMPPSAHEFALDDMTFSNSEAIQFVRKQKNKEKEKNAYVFFPGCQLPTVLSDQVTGAYEYLQKHLEGGVGFHLGCCGMPAQWAAQDVYLTQIIAEFKEKWEALERPTYIFACASCSEFYKKNCPEVEQISLWEVLETLPLPEKTAHFSAQTLAVHDPCSSRDSKKMQGSVRTLLKSIGQNFEDLEYSQELTRCCGYGGLSSNVNSSIADTFLQTRKDETDKTLLVYCAICRERYQKIEQNSLHILELLFPHKGDKQEKSSEELLEIASQKNHLSLFERQEKRYEFKETILENIWGEKTKNMENQTITLNISDDLKETIGERNILKEDIISVILQTKHDNSAFYNNETGHLLGAYRPRLVTYWVEYIEESDGSFTIFDAYCHRMIVPGITSENKPSLYKEKCCIK